MLEHSTVKLLNTLNCVWQKPKNYTNYQARFSKSTKRKKKIVVDARLMCLLTVWIIIMLILYSVELNSLLLEISLRAPKSTTTTTDFGCFPSYFYDWCAFFRDHQIPMPSRRKMSWNVLPSLTVKVKS